MSDETVPCQQNPELRRLILEYSEILKTQAHRLGEHGLDENDFYQSGLFRGVIERIRGQLAATMKPKRKFVATVLDFLKAQGAIEDWSSAGEANRHDYRVDLHGGRIAIIELKGCLDGNNTNIFERPPHANEFIVWSVCQNPGSDPRHNVWSGIHTRLGAEIIDRSQIVDGLIVWDMLCGTSGRPCPKVGSDPASGDLFQLSEYKLPPPCLYLFPSTVPSPRNNPAPPPQTLAEVHLMKAFSDVFGGQGGEINQVLFEVSYSSSETVRKTRIMRDGVEVATSGLTPIQRA
ncbi:MAG: hypothetical protein KZQ99_03455 [Candidatus Thiodiazotropha sp. (ex Dulcina madagascariensis)]|nr:hypothetical protein [Candidatus Thiodiazotropha sp. (ex Dulcina madagascariensis)]